MAFIAWKDAFKSGHPSVDHEHENLIILINEMHAKIGEDCPQDLIHQYLGEIHALVEAHFALEEKIMRDINYRDYAAHKEDHEDLLEEIRDIMEGVGNDTRADYKESLAHKMNAWFGVHFTTFDREFHQAHP